MSISKNPKVWWLLHWSHPWVHWWNWKKNTIKKDIKSKACMHVKLLQLCTTLWDPMDCSPPGCSVHGILQARTLEWVAMPSFRGSCQSGDRMQISYASCIGRWVHYHWHHLRSPTGLHRCNPNLCLYIIATNIPGMDFNPFLNGEVEQVNHVFFSQ